MSEKGSEPASRTNWARVDALADEDVDTSEAPPLTEEFFCRARLRKPTIGDCVRNMLSPRKHPE